MPSISEQFHPCGPDCGKKIGMASVAGGFSPGPEGRKERAAIERALQCGLGPMGDGAFMTPEVDVEQEVCYVTGRGGASPMIKKVGVIDVMIDILKRHGISAAPRV